MPHFFKTPAFLKSTHTDPFAAWFVQSGDATPDGIRVVRSVLGAISSLHIVAFREKQSCVALTGPMRAPAPWKCPLVTMKSTYRASVYSLA